tara:strand:+ start:312 stop:911 length:600 start_codon:yes stop_codon:yes gene_type:complete
MKPILDIPIRYLSALIITAAKKDVRYYLNGIHVTNTYAESTDGHRVLRLDLDDGYKVEPELDIIIPRESVELFLKSQTAKQKANNDVVLYKDTLFGGRYVLSSGDFGIPFTVLSNRFPTVDRVLAKHQEVDFHGTFQWNYMADFEKAAKALGHKLPIIQLIPNGNSTALVNILGVDYATAAIMPMRLPKDARVYPVRAA